MTKYLITIQAYVDTDSPETAECVAVEAADYLEDNNLAESVSIQTCVVQKAPFRPLGRNFMEGRSCEAEIEDADG